MKDISDQEVMAHLKRLNRWWTPKVDADGLARELKPRAYLDAVQSLVTDTSLRRAVVLMGPRRVGKTILIRHLIGRLLDSGIPARRIAYAEVDHPILHGQSLESLVRLMQEASEETSDDGPRFIFFDEIQYLKDWERHLKSLVDHRPNLRILVSGSAAAALKRRSRESGAGRFTDFLLPPLTFPEYLELSRADPSMRAIGQDSYEIADIERLNMQFEDYVNFGGYPELALSPAVRSDPQRFVKSDIVDKVLLRDLPQLYGIQDIQELNALFTLLAYNTGEEVSLEGLSKRSGMGKPTISRYVEYLEAAFLLQRVFRVDQSGRRYQRERAFKVYLTNSAMRTGLFGPISGDDERFGHLVETALFSQRFHENARLHYARWGQSDHEVDMIELDAALKPIVAIEVKWTNRSFERPSELGGLLRFCEANTLQRGWATTRDRFGQKTIGNTNLIFWPAAALAFHFGMSAIKGRLSNIALSLKGIPESNAGDE